ncbi:MAG: WxcM-like domain-containing protein [Burkholderiales bacterium]|nr:WxcM-like domain-containing protein [Burkholderiales bacterium]
MPISARAWFDERAPADLGVGGAALVRMHSIYEQRGHLTVGEVGKGMPFVPRRFFVISDVPDEGIRGEHAHHALHQLLVCLAGSVVAEVSDASASRAISLDCPHVGLHIPPMVWGVQHHYTRDAVLMVLASAEYDPADYIRDFARFKALRAGAVR